MNEPDKSAPVDNRTRALDVSNPHLGFRARLDAAKLEGRNVVYLPHQASRQRCRYLRQQIIAGMRKLHASPKPIREQDLLGDTDTHEKFRKADYPTLLAMWEAVKKALADA